MIWLYRFFVAPLTFFIAVIFSPFSKKIQNSLKLRRSLNGNPYWKIHQFDQPPIWIHAASGEFEYARPVIRKLKQRYPHVKVLVTFTSNSFQKVVAGERGVDWSLPLPYDFPGPTAEFLEHVRPRICLIARTDLWPELIYQLRQRQIPIWLFSATQRPASLVSAYGFLKSVLLSQLQKIFCVSKDDEINLHRLNANLNVHTIGDTRYDQVIHRLQLAAPNQPRIAKTRIQIVLGSTWPEDDEIWIQALKTLSLNEFCLYWVPHEIQHVDRLLQTLRAAGVRTYRKSDLKDEDFDVCVVDTVGVLAELYLDADLAFVGGSFRQKVHSVMESLAAGNPTLVGPFHLNNREAVEYKDQIVSDELRAVSVAQNANEVVAWVQNWKRKIRDRAAFDSCRSTIKSSIEKRAGASERLIEELNKALSLVP